MKRFLHAFLLLMPPAFLIAVKYDIPHVPVITLLILAFVLIFGGKRKHSSVIDLLIAALLSFPPSFIFTIEPVRFALTDAILRTHIFVPFLLYFTALRYRKSAAPGEDAVMLLLSCFTILVCGDMYPVREITNKRFPFTSFLLKKYHVLYVTAVLMQTAGALLLLMSETRPAVPEDKGKIRLIWLFRLLALLLIPLFYFSLSFTYQKNLPGIRKMEGYFLRHRRWRKHGLNMSGAESDISRSMPRDYPEIADKVLLYARSSKAPGYLTLRIYDTYRPGGRWKNSRSEASKLPDWTMDAELSPSLYPLNGNTKQSIAEMPSMEIFFAPLYRDLDDVLPLPSRAGAVEAVSDSASITEDGVISMENMTRSAGYTVYLQPGQPPQEYEVTELRRFLKLPPRFIRFLRGFNATIFYGRRTDREKMVLITDFLSRNYVYSLTPPERHGTPPADPIVNFLMYSGQGHCELFASSAVLLLRAAGVPARYVTGFTCEVQAGENLYVSRIRDSHAWVEAYDRDSQHWFLLDPTPSVPDDGKFAQFSGTWDNFTFSFLSFFTKGYPAKYIRRGWDGAVQGIIMIFTTPAGILSVILLLMGTGTVLLYYRKKHAGYRSRRSNQLRHARKIMNSVEKKITRQTGVIRPASLSRTEWCESFRSETFFEELKKIIITYEKLRYSPVDPDPEELKAWEDAARTFRNKKQIPLSNSIV